MSRSADTSKKPDNVISVSRLGLRFPVEIALSATCETFSSSRPTPFSRSPAFASSRVLVSELLHGHDLAFTDRDQGGGVQSGALTKLSLALALLVAPSFTLADAGADIASGSASNGRIVFQSSRDGDYDIYAMNPDGTGLTELTHNDFEDSSPVPSPDGRLIAFHSHDGFTLINADGSGRRLLEGCGGTDTTWSPGLDPARLPSRGRLRHRSRGRRRRYRHVQASGPAGASSPLVAGRAHDRVRGRRSLRRSGRGRHAPTTRPPQARHVQPALLVAGFAAARLRRVNRLELPGRPVHDPCRRLRRAPPGAAHCRTAAVHWSPRAR